jgi:tetratricopeptide (TPR) repeat protein
VRAWVLASSLLGASVLGVGCVEYRVVRDFGDGPLLGRYISPEAYALYGRGRDAEAANKLEEALAFYGRAGEKDAQSPAMPTREGAVLCALGRASEAERAFDRAERRGPAFGPLWEERARCSLRMGRSADALERALRGVEADPDSLILTELAAEALGRLGRGREATEILLAYTLLHPASREAREALSKRALASGPGALARAPEGADLDAVDAAWKRGDVAAAKRAGRKAGLSSGEIALRGVLAGRAADALALAELVRAADPDDATARVAAAAALEALGRLSEAAKRSRGPSPRILRRRSRARRSRRC